MTASTQVVGVGARRMVMFDLDEDGLPYQAVHSQTPQEGTRIGIREFEVTPAAPEQIVHRFDDNTKIVDYMEPDGVDTITITAGRTDLTADASAVGNKVRSLSTDLKARAGGSGSNAFDEYKMLITYQQAVVADLNSPGLGKVRQWHGFIIPATMLTPQPQSQNRNPSQKTYSGALTTVTSTPWLEDLTDVDWGSAKGSYFEFISDYQPVVNVWLGNSTETEFNLSHSPVDAAHLLVWVNGTLTAPSAVTLGATPSFELGSAPAAVQVFAIILTDAPGA